MSDIMEIVSLSHHFVCQQPGLHNPYYIITGREIFSILPNLGPCRHKYIAPTFPVFHAFSLIKSGQAGRIFARMLRRIYFGVRRFEVNFASFSSSLYHLHL